MTDDSISGGTNLSSPTFPSFVLAYHGCDARVGERVLAGTAELEPSTNEYDWLGHGIYFWENNFSRALEWAHELKIRSKIKTPFVVGVVLDLGLCLDLLQSENLRIVKAGYLALKTNIEERGGALPKNLAPKSKAERLMRHLDCAVIEAVHAATDESSSPPFDSVRAAFMEGQPLYPNAGFQEKNHIQICVRNTACIRAYFRPREMNGQHPKSRKKKKR